jgi:hypothetical protein
MTNQFAVTLRLMVAGPDRAAHFEQVADCFARLEQQHDSLLDCAWSLSDGDEFADVDVELTVAAPDEAFAYELASSSVRAAIHEAGGYTPGWDERAPDLDVVVYRLTHEEVTLV